MGLGLGTLPYQRERAHKSCAGLTALGGNIFPCFSSKNGLSFLLQVCASYSTWPTPLLYLSSPGRGQVFLLHHRRGRQPAMHWPWEDTRCLQGTKPTPDADLALSSLLYVSKALFHSVCLSTVYSWWLQYSEEVDRSVWTSIPGGWHCDGLY